MVVFLLATLLFSSNILGETLSLKNKILLVSADLVSDYLACTAKGFFLVAGSYVCFAGDGFCHDDRDFGCKTCRYFTSFSVMVLIILIPLDFRFEVSIYVLFSSLAGIALTDIGEKRIDLILTRSVTGFCKSNFVLTIAIVERKIRSNFSRTFWVYGIECFATAIVILGFCQF